MTPVIELVICTYNNASMLSQVLEAIAQQEVPSEVQWGVLVVDNNCSDHTVDVVEQHIQSGKIPHLRMILEPTQGLTPARLCGVCNTSAQWIAFVDDDCILRPDWVANAVNFAIKHPHCGAFGGRVTLHWETPPPTYVLNFTYSFAEQEHGSHAKRVSCLVGAGMILNRTALKAVGWLEQQFLADRTGQKLISGGDVELALRVASRYELWYIPDCQLHHLIPNRRTSFTYLKRINFGLGSSKLFGDSLQWDRSFAAWFFASSWEGWQQITYASCQALKALWRPQSRLAAIITLHFWWGYWVGIWHMLRMEPQQRQQIIGCAVNTTCLPILKNLV